MTDQERENRKFYSYPTGYGSDGGFSFLCGNPRHYPKYLEADDDAAKGAWFHGYDQAAKLWPTPKDREWFSP